ncbi:MAG: tRNA (adenosine(37)-N6)-dimethylallyltransferase MiaA [Ginsengibacter sp.]
MNKKICLIISGPTAVGKTSYGIELASKYHTEIISADSRQCYKELNIGVAKPSRAQLEKVKHYFINTHSIHEEINVKTFEQYALHAVNEIFKKNEIAIMVGGTGLYIKAFADGLDDIPEIDEAIRNYVLDQYSLHGLQWLSEEIKLKDPIFLANGAMHNPRRMARALEVKLSTGQSILNFHSGKKTKRDFEVRYILLEMPREKLYNKINHRVDEMMEAGFLKEAENLLPFKDLKALQTVGYKELFAHLEGKLSLNKAIEEIKRNTRHYAKRQMTWFKKLEPGLKVDRGDC